MRELNLIILVQILNYKLWSFDPNKMTLVMAN